MYDLQKEIAHIQVSKCFTKKSENDYGDFRNFILDPRMKNIYKTEPTNFGDQYHLPITVQASPEQYITKKGIVKVRILGIPVSMVDK